MPKRKRRLDPDDLLGSDTDEEIAGIVGWTVERVRRRRIRFKIPAFGPPRAPAEWSDDELALLGTMPDRTLAKQLHRGEATVGRMRRRREIPAFRPVSRWKPEEDALLECFGDAEVAKRLERNILSVRQRRHRLQIPIRIRSGHG